MVKNMHTSENKEMLCVKCPYSPINQIIRNGGEEICPDAYKEIAKYCNLNNLYNINESYKRRQVNE